MAPANDKPALIGRSSNTLKIRRGPLAAMKCGEPLASGAKPKLVQIALAREREAEQVLVAQSTPATGAWDVRDCRRVNCCDCMIVLLLTAGDTGLILLFASLLTIPLARQRFLHAALLAGLQVEGMTLHFFDDVFLLYLPLKPAQRIFKRFAFLHANLCQCTTPPNLPNWAVIDYRNQFPNSQRLFSRQNSDDRTDGGEGEPYRKINMERQR